MKLIRILLCCIGGVLCVNLFVGFLAVPYIFKMNILLTSFWYASGFGIFLGIAFYNIILINHR